MMGLYDGHVGVSALSQIIAHCLASSQVPCRRFSWDQRRRKAWCASSCLSSNSLNVVPGKEVPGSSQQRRIAARKEEC